MSRVEAPARERESATAALELAALRRVRRRIDEEEAQAEGFLALPLPTPGRAPKTASR